MTQLPSSGNGNLKLYNFLFSFSQPYRISYLSRIADHQQWVSVKSRRQTNDFRSTLSKIFKIFLFEDLRELAERAFEIPRMYNLYPEKGKGAFLKQNRD